MEPGSIGLLEENRLRSMPSGSGSSGSPDERDRSRACLEQCLRAFAAKSRLNPGEVRFFPVVFFFGSVHPRPSKPFGICFFTWNFLAPPNHLANATFDTTSIAMNGSKHSRKIVLLNFVNECLMPLATTPNSRCFSPRPGCFFCCWRCFWSFPLYLILESIRWQTDIGFCCVGSVQIGGRWSHLIKTHQPPPSGEASPCSRRVKHHPIRASNPGVESWAPEVKPLSSVKKCFRVFGASESLANSSPSPWDRAASAWAAPRRVPDASWGGWRSAMWPCGSSIQNKPTGAMHFGGSNECLANRIAFGGV